MAKIYDIVSVKYVKVPTGEKYPNDYKRTNLRGKLKYSTTRTNPRTINSNWGSVRKNAYDLSSSGNAFVKWSKPKRKLVSVTQTFPDGTKEVTYYKPKRG